MHKELYGEVGTPAVLVERLISLIPTSRLRDSSTIYMEAGAGDGRISRMLVDRVTETDASQSDSIRGRIHMTELQERHHPAIRRAMGSSVVLTKDFLSSEGLFDVVFGNPPYNFGGNIKVPTNTQLDKKRDGRALWKEFVKHAFTILKPGGYLVFLMPSLWLKPDKEKVYDLINSFAVEKLIGFSASETHKLFMGKAQTPLTLVRLRKSPPIPNIAIYDSVSNSYIPYPHRVPMPIPLKCPGILQKVRAGLSTDQIGIPIVRTNSAPKNTELAQEASDQCQYPNIRTTHLTKGIPRLITEWSDRPLAYAGVTKLALPHKMYGMPYLDTTGKFGLSRRDIYVITGTISTLAIYRQFLCSRLVLYLYETTRYRMRFLERYVFQLLPDPTKLPDLPSKYSDAELYRHFNLSAAEVNEIERCVPDHICCEYDTET